MLKRNIAKYLKSKYFNVQFDKDSESGSVCTDIHERQQQYMNAIAIDAWIEVSEIDMRLNGFQRFLNLNYFMRL